MLFGGEYDLSRSERKRKTEFRRNVNNITPMYRHRCAICGRTEISDPDLEFRFCSKCEGNYEYCSDHLYTHQHIQKVKTESGFGPDTK